MSISQYPLKPRCLGALALKHTAGPTMELFGDPPARGVRGPWEQWRYSWWGN